MICKQLSFYQLLVLVGFAISCGCNSRQKLVPISGQVTIDGKPLKQGNITIWVKDYRPASGVIKEGRYQLTTFKDGDGCVVGEHEVTISSRKKITDDSSEYLIPMIYCRQGESKLKIKVDQPRSDVNFDLTWKVDPQHKGPFIVN
jgi:hypothetical protein